MQKKFRKSLLAYKIRFAVEKKNKKILGQIFKINSKIFVSPSKNASQGNSMESIFFSKKIFQSFFLSPVCSTVPKKPQKWLNFFSSVFRKCMKIVSQAFSPCT